LSETLQWSGEIAAQIPTKTMALIRDRLLAEASTAAWQDFFWFNALVAIFCLVPALPFWRRKKYQAPATSQKAAAVAHGAAGGKGDPKL
jgi:cytochrome c-type biogenesis protein CcmH/NrfG